MMIFHILGGQFDLKEIYYLFLKSWVSYAVVRIMFSLR